MKSASFVSCLILICSNFIPNASVYTEQHHERIHVAGLILARCGSKGIPKKNLALIGNESLLQRSLVTIHNFGGFSSVWVSTDCNEIAQEAYLSGAQVYRRSSNSATDSASSLLAVQEFIATHIDIDMVGLIQCTSPFLATPFLHSALALSIQGRYDSVFSVTRQHKLRWQVISNGTVQAANFNPASRPRRQDWEGELVENGMFYFMRRNLVEKGLLQGGRMAVVEVPINCSLEVDSPADLTAAVELSRLLGPRRC